MRMRQVEERYTPQELREYEACKIAYRDINNSVDTAKREGIAEGMEKGKEKPWDCQEDADKGYGWSDCDGNNGAVGRTDTAAESGDVDDRFARLKGIFAPKFR